MKKIRFLFFAVSLFLGLSGSAVYSQTQTALDLSQERSARIDVYSANKGFDLLNVTSNGNLQKPSSDSKTKNRWYISYLKLKKDSKAWTELWIEFTPASSGNVFIELRGSIFSDLKTNHHAVWVDDVSVTGPDSVSIKNGSFETLNAKGFPEWWFWPAASKDNLSVDANQAHAGKTCVSVYHDGQIIQNVTVKANKKYRVSAWFKAY